MKAGSVGSKLIRESYFAITVKTAALAGRLEEKYFHFPVFRVITTVCFPANDELVSFVAAKPTRCSSNPAVWEESVIVSRYVPAFSDETRLPPAASVALAVLTEDASVPTTGVGWPELVVVVGDVVGPVVVLAGCPTTNIPVISAAWVSHWKT